MLQDDEMMGMDWELSGTLGQRQGSARAALWFGACF
jgi:hypothetical protein